MRNKQVPSEGKIGKRMTAVGVIGSLGLAGVFFLLGVFCIAPLVKSYMASRTQTPQKVYSPPIHQQSRDATGAQQEPQQPLDVQITEQGKDATPPEDQAQPGDEGVKQDGNDLTITLPENGDSESAAKPAEPEKPRKQNAGQDTTTSEKPRASTDSHSPPPSDRIYRIQAGTFASRANAETLRDDLRARGYHPEIKSVQSQGTTLYRVQLGGFRSEEGAKGLAKDLSSDGYTPTVIIEKPEQ